MTCPLSQSPQTPSPQPCSSPGHWGLWVPGPSGVLLSKVLTGRGEAPGGRRLGAAHGLLPLGSCARGLAAKGGRVSIP